MTTHTATGKKTITASMPAPSDGSWVNFYIEVKFLTKHPSPFTSSQLPVPKKRSGGPGPLPGTVRDLIREEFGGSIFSHDFGGFFDVTTEVSVWPNTFPYEDCAGEACGVRLV